MIRKIAEGVYQVAGPPISEEGQAFLIVGRKKVLVDAGIYGETALLGLVELMVKPNEIAWLINTHAHYDRAAADNFFWKMGISVAAGERDARAIEKGEVEYCDGPVSPTPVGWHIRKEAEIDDVKIIPLPGHTKGSLGVYYNGVLIAGDLFGPLSKRWESDEAEWRKSLKRVMELNPRILCTNNFCIFGRIKETIEKVLERGAVWT